MLRFLFLFLLIFVIFSFSFFNLVTFIQEFIDFPLQINLSGISDVLYNSFFVNQDYFWNSFNLKKFYCIMFLFPSSYIIMIYVFPVFLYNSLNNCFFFIINRDPNNFNFIIPFLFVFFYHYWIMIHWFLARPTPCCPNIDKKDLTLLMNYLYWFITIK